MMVLAVLCLNVSQPGFGLKQQPYASDFQMVDVSA